MNVEAFTDALCMAFMAAGVLALIYKLWSVRNER